jgi:hypothetical protein
MVRRFACPQESLAPRELIPITDSGSPALSMIECQREVTVHEVRVTDVQRGIERRRRFPSASVDQTDARNAPADNLVIDQLGWIECLASGR